MKKVTIWLMLSCLILSLGIGPSATKTAAASALSEAVLLNAGQETVLETGTAEKNTYWYKVEHQAGVEKTASHFELSLDTDQPIEVTAYPSQEMASKDETFDRYRGYAEPSDKDATKIAVPYAWDGPYYVKVDYYPEIEEGKTPKAAHVKLTYNNVKLPVEYEPISDDMSCMAEEALKQTTDEKPLLALMHAIQKQVLSQSEQGRDLTSLYYKVSPYVVKTLLFNKDKRTQTYEDLKTLKPAMTALVNGTAYTLTKTDQTAINRLHALTRDASPEVIATEINQVAKTAGIETIGGSDLSEAFKPFGIKVKSEAKTRFIVKLKPGHTQRTMKIAGAQAPDVEKLSLGKTGEFVIVTEDPTVKNQSAAVLKQSLKKSSAVEYVEEVQTYRATGDINYDYQWSLNQKSNVEQFPNAGIGFEQFEKYRAGKTLAPVTIAVIDTGVDYRLKDFQGKVDIAQEKNYVDVNGNGNALDDHGHGTHVSGVIAAALENDYGIRGIHQSAKILPIKVLNANGEGETDAIALGIKYAVDHGAKIINMSLGGGESRTMAYMMKYAADHGVTVVAASGNEYDMSVGFPASSEYAISVGATNPLGMVADYSNYGIGLDVVAPGSKIASLVPDGNTVYMDGTSMASPHVAAVAGILASLDSKLTPKQIEAILRTSAEPLAFENPNDWYDEDEEMEDEYPPGYEKDSTPEFPAYVSPVSGYGKVNITRAIAQLNLKGKVNPVYDNQLVVSGQVKSGTTVEVWSTKKLTDTKDTSKRLAKTTAKAGKYSVTIPRQEKETVLTIRYANGSDVTSERTEVLPGKAPAAPKVNRVLAGATTVTGTAIAKGKITITDAKNKVVGTATIDSKGKFAVKVKKQAANARLAVTVKDIANRSSKATVITVVAPPAAPKVKSVTAGQTKVTGTGEKKARVYVQNEKKKVIGKGTVTSKGTFTVKIAKQKAGAKLSVYVENSFKQKSTSTVVVVKKAKK
ncbi:S8 family peptidase [Exiguobacterium undae]|uniref:Peptidase S8 n=1 Tax=Exiguobacterium undae TaxID=169177 RepID=A0ABX2V636_9BACL|nr:S8 family serine peptidase [Exiguobacterium undae]OAN10746.1 peptidase S8 [Exiguobacterium undae]